MSKSILRECWEGYVVKVMKDVRDEAHNCSSFKLRSPTRQDIVNWVHRGYVLPEESKAMFQHIFEVCGTTTTNLVLACMMIL